MHSIAAVPASTTDYDRTTATLVAAFIADPFNRWLLPDSRLYLDTFPLVVKYFAGRAFDHASAYRTDDFTAAALWLPPEVGPDEEALGEVMQEAIMPERQAEAFEVLEQMGGCHPAEPHWYLPLMGVEPMSQGKGYGSALLRHSLEVCDRDHAPAYLESSNPTNIPLYERFGFEVMAKVQVGNSPVVTPMFRGPR